jgi:hypothetical protein
MAEYGMRGMRGSVSPLWKRPGTRRLRPPV